MDEKTDVAELKRLAVSFTDTNEKELMMLILIEILQELREMNK